MAKKKKSGKKAEPSARASARRKEAAEPRDRSSRRRSGRKETQAEKDLREHTGRTLAPLLFG